MNFNLLFSNLELTKLIIAAAMMAVAVVDDIKNQKVHNFIVVIFFAMSWLILFWLEGLSGFALGMGSLAAAFIFGIPIYKLKIFAGGDLKILLAISPLLIWKDILVLLFSSFIWGSLLGILFVLLKGNYKQFLNNMFLLFSKTKPAATATHKIPYTVALFFGLLTVWTINTTGGLL